VVEAVRSGVKGNLLHWAASMAFYAVLSFAPLLLVVMIVTSFFTDVDWAAGRLSTILGNFMSDESEDQLREFVSNAVESRDQIGIISFVAFLYTGTRVFASLTRALHVIYEQEQERQILREVGVQIVMLLTIGAVFLFALSSRYFFGLLANAVDFLPSGEEQAAQRLIAGMIQIMLLFGAFTLIYRFIPSSEDEWRPPLIGAGVATLLFVVARPLFIYYLNRFGNQDVVYGSLASLMVLLIWVWIGAIITLFGGAIASSARKVIPDAA
jgi:membrane protein